mgnify:CR=1 FL=1
METWITGALFSALMGYVAFTRNATDKRILKLEKDTHSNTVATQVMQSEMASIRELIKVQFSHQDDKLDELKTLIIDARRARYVEPTSGRS